MSLDPTTWIDTQRAAGDGRGNIFKAILAAAAERRAEGLSGSEYRAHQRAMRVQQIRERSARIDAHIEATNFGPIPKDVY